MGKKTFPVGTISGRELFQAEELNLRIPPYQRPYVWTEANINELLQDWDDHFFELVDGAERFTDDCVEYYLGLIMVYDNQKEKHLEIIDGQQRLTTLLIMDYVWNGDDAVLKKDSKNLNFEYTSQLSFKQISENKKLLSSLWENRIAKHFNKILDKLVFSVIITESEDDAFVFFDSQNNRGIPLDEVDFFKSYHLREIKDNETYLRYFARKFDSINALSKSMQKSHVQSLNQLFVNHIWKVRFWSKHALHFPNRRKLLETFQKDTISFGRVDEIRLYPSMQNSLGSTLVFDEEMNPELRSSIKMIGSDSLAIPFTINQPIQRGIGFFLYTEKYSALFNMLFLEEKVDALKPVTELVYKVYNSYFINLYQIAIMHYYDKFGRELLEAFAKCFVPYLYLEHPNLLIINKYYFLYR